MSEQFTAKLVRLLIMRAVITLVFVAPLFLRAADDLPSSSNVVHRLIERSHFVARAPQTNHYTYEKRSVTAELDENDRVIKSTEKLYKVILVGGWPFPRLVKVQGRELSPKQLEAENRREKAFRQKITRVDAQKKAEEKEGFITREMVDKFDFKVVRRETVNGRTTLVLTFAARAGLPEADMEDKILKRVTGTVWVDEAEAEIARLDAGVRGPIPLGWFGAIGSLDKFHVTMDRVRMPEGVWVNRSNTFLLDARKLFTRLRFKTTEESSGWGRE